MGRKLPPGFVDKDTLLKRFENLYGRKLHKAMEKCGKDDLVYRAFREGLMTEMERDASLCRRVSTIPCYLYTHVKNQEFLDIIDTYVQHYSMLWTRGSIITNLVVMRSIPEVVNNPFTTQELLALPDILMDENIVKLSFLPERWILKETPTSKVKVPDEIKDILNEHGNLLAPFLPAYTWLCDTGWDNALNHMGTSYLGNVKVQVLSRLFPRINTYIKDVHHLQEGTNRISFKILCFGRQYPCSSIHVDDYPFIQHFRDFFNVVGLTSYLNDSNKFFKELDDRTWTFHVWLQNMMTEANPDKQFSLVPSATLGRKYAYIDTKVLGSMVKGNLKNEICPEGFSLREAFGLSRETFQKTMSEKRKKLKQKYKNCPGKQGLSAKDNKKIKEKLNKKWRVHGRGCLPKDAVIKTITTDGVGMRIHLDFKTDEIPHDADIEKPPFTERDAVDLGGDKGRVRMLTTADSRGNVNMITRKAYYRAQHDHKDKLWEQEQMTGTWKDAIDGMSQAGGFKNRNEETWINTLNVMVQFFNTIKEAQLVSKDRAFRKMRRFRQKRSFMDSNIKRLFKPAMGPEGVVMNVGIGHAGFASTGRGEQSVPTVGFERAVYRVLKTTWIDKNTRLESRVRMLKPNEDRTTMCCHACGAVMEKLQRPDGRDCQRYRLCTCCPETSYKRRHRDVNAAKNILKITSCLVRGLPRPEYLCRASRASPAAA